MKLSKELLNRILQVIGSQPYGFKAPNNDCYIMFDEIQITNVGDCDSVLIFKKDRVELIRHEINVTINFGDNLNIGNLKGALKVDI